MTPEGSRAIEGLRVGDWVLSLPEDEPEATPEPRRVVSVFASYAPLLELVVGGRTIRTTAEHPFWVVGQGWRAAHQLVVGDVLMSAQKHPVVLEAIEGDREAAAVYNVEVEGYHTYFVGSPAWGWAVWAHNARCKVDAEGNPYPHGFDSSNEFHQFGSRLRRDLPEGTQPVFQGSSVTGKSYKTGMPFDVGRQSDFDIGLAGSELFENAKALGLKAKDGTRIGPLSPQDLNSLGLSSLQGQLSQMAGRPVNFMLFDSIGSAYKRPSMWVP